MLGFDVVFVNCPTSAITAMFCRHHTPYPSYGLGKTDNNPATFGGSAHAVWERIVRVKVLGMCNTDANNQKGASAAYGIQS